MANTMVEMVELLLHEEESSSLDFKRDQYVLENATDHQKSKLVKDILAFANAFRRDDAYILIGVEDVKGGRSKPVGIQADLDDADLQQLVNSKTNKPITFSYSVIPFEEVRIGVIHIPVQQRPFFLIKDFGPLRRNVVYIRRGSSTDEATPDEIILMGTPFDKGPVSYEPNLVICFNNDETTKKVVVAPFQRKDEKEIVAALEEFKKQHPFVRPDEQTDKQAVDNEDSLKNPLLVLGPELKKIMFPPITEEKAEDYNRYLERKYHEYEEYLVEKADYEDHQIGRVDILLKMNNNGTAPAEEIDIWLHFPDGMTVISEEDLTDFREDVPFRTPQSVYTYNSIHEYRPPLYDRNWALVDAISRVNTPPPNIGSPTIRRTNSFEVTSKVQRVKHHHAVYLNTIIVLFDDYDSASTFTIDYKVTAANVPNVITGSLTLEVEKEYNNPVRPY